MRRLLATIACLLLAAPGAYAQYAPQISFDSVPDFFQLPQGMNFGEVSAIAVNSQGHVFVFHRSNPFGGGPAYGMHAAQLFEFDDSGRYQRELGRGLYAWSFAHGLRIDSNDDIWTVDKGSNMVVRMDPAGRVVWVFGRKTESVSEAAQPFERVDTPRPPRTGVFGSPRMWRLIRQAIFTSPMAISIPASPNMITTVTG